MTAKVKITLDNLVLAKGAHGSPAGGLCFAEAAAYFAGRPHTDHPPCVSPVIAAFGRSWNDALNDEDRQMLKPFVPLVLNTATTAEDEARRAWLATDWLVREFTPAWLERAGLTEHATNLRGLPEMSSPELANAAMPVIESARSASAAAWDAAVVAAWDAARVAAWDAAWDAAGAAAWDAAWVAAGAAAGAAAWDAAWDAARVAAGAAVEPTVVELQQSALGLLQRMIDVGKSEPVAA